MDMQERWKVLNKETRDKLQGHHGSVAFREVVAAIVFLAGHECLKEALPLEYHPKLELVWYGSHLPMHPLHKVRTAVHRKVADWAVEADDYFDRPLQKKFAWIDDQIARLEVFIDLHLVSLLSAQA
jgi:hypothetical protein